jgi:MFS family permease
VTERWLYSWALGAVAFGGASLLVPLYVVQLDGTAVDLGLLAATAALVAAPGAIVFGRLGNRVDQRRPLVLGTLAVVAGVLAVIPLLGSVPAVIVANAVLWLMVSSIPPVLTMLVVDDAPESAWTERIGRLNKYQGYGWAGGLVLGTVWPSLGGRLLVPEGLLAPGAVTPALFWVLAGCAGLGVLGAVGSLPRPDPTRHVTSERRIRKIARVLSNSRRGVKGATFAFSPNRLYWTTRTIHPRRLLARLDRALALYLFAAVCFFTGFAAFWAPLPLFFTGIEFGSGEIFALYLASSVASAVLYEGAGRLASRMDVRLLQSGALAVRGLLFPVVALVGGVGAAAVELGVAALGLAAIGATWAIIAVVGTAIVTRLAPHSVRGEVLGVHTALGAVAGGVGGILGGWAATFGYTVAFGVAGGLVLVGAGLVFALRFVGETPQRPVAESDPVTARVESAETALSSSGQD